MQIQPTSLAFTLLLGFLAAVPYSGIDINLPALAATGATLGASPSDVGLTMSAFMLSLAVAPLLYGPISDRIGRKPVVMAGVALFVMASLACAAADSLWMLLICRFVQGVGAASTTMTFAIIRDLFGETTARAKIASVVIAVNVVTVVAPSAGAALLAVGSWRLIYLTQAAAGSVLLLAVLLGFAETAKIAAAGRLRPSAVIADYRRVLTNPAALAFILVGAAGGATVFAYVTGSSLFFIGVVGLRPDQYGLIFSACSAAVMCGAFLDSRLGRRGIAPTTVLTIGLVLLFTVTSALLAMTLAHWTPPALLAALLMAVALAFGLSMPNIMNATMQPLPDIAGAVGAAAGSIQMTSGAIASGLVATLFDGHSALSMTAVMAAASLLALLLYLLFARPAVRRLHPAPALTPAQ
ncbi:multidrug effflux MFS transporter [Bradyrhizobium ivorense]|uniref:multidrug effflux MFS transporter n=1 Tax=Bradyrhizobium ivorense TaxID=2511166 RepID=UPI0010BADA93|nr:multidrug effflux MFS transporter [Bradyrhizobium ivorense]VIO77725.1 Bicyclomycin resistance protein [Bradyrhizobium ivorense]